MGGVKENDGKAARRKLSFKITLVVGVAMSCLFVITMFGGGKKGLNSAQRKGLLRKSVTNSNDYVSSLLSSDIQALLQKRRLTTEEKLKLILSGSVHLTSLHPGHRPTATFCRLRWQVHKKDPATVPMFRDLLKKSGHCQDHSFDVNLNEIIGRVREFDEKMAEKSGDAESYAPRAMLPAGFVFHESRCGSTLVANSLAAVNPEMNRVYSESQPALAALTSCGEDYTRCSKSHAAQLFRDVVYMMGRTDDPKERRLFFKIQSAGSKNIGVMQEAFPDAPWIYVYREPVQVMMSHLPHANTKMAVCLRSRHQPPRAVRNLIKESDRSAKAEDLTTEEYCAAHLASLCTAAYKEYSNNPKMGRFVNYVDLPHVLLDSIFPHHFNIDVGPGEEERVNSVCKVYSKSRKAGQTWEEDSKKKDDNASPEIRSASFKYLEGVYHQMEETKKLYPN